MEPVRTGDTIAIFSTGACGHSMASNYNTMPVPAVDFLEKGKDELVTKRPSFDDFVQNDLITECLK